MVKVILLIIFAGAALYFALRLFLVHRGMDTAGRALSEISGMPEENRVLKSEIPDRHLEGLLEKINENLTELQKYRIQYMAQETALREQVEEISHDLRTPLTAILGYLKMMDRESLEAEDREALEVAVKKSEPLQGLIQQFYELSQVTSENFRLEADRLDAAKLVRECCLAYYEVLEQRKLEAKIEIPDGPVWISADRNGLERVISNLLKNIERYAVSEFYVILYSDGGRIRLVFGNDIELDMRRENPEKLFERFYMGSASRSRGGTGLGLTISRHLVEGMHGKIHASYQERKGKDYLEIEICIM